MGFLSRFPRVGWATVSCDGPRGMQSKKEDSKTVRMLVQAERLIGLTNHIGEVSWRECLHIGPLC